MKMAAPFSSAWLKQKKYFAGRNPIDLKAPLNSFTEEDPEKSENCISSRCVFQISTVSLCNQLHPKRSTGLESGSNRMQFQCLPHDLANLQPPIEY